MIIKLNQFFLSYDRHIFPTAMNDNPQRFSLRVNCLWVLVTLQSTTKFYEFDPFL